MAFSETFYLCRILGEGSFEIVDTVSDRASVDAYDLTGIAGELIWHNETSEFSPLNYTFVDGTFQPIADVREPTVTEIVRLLIAKGIITLAEIDVYDQRVGNLIRLKKG